MSVAQIVQRAQTHRIRTSADAKAAQRKAFVRFRADHAAGGQRLTGFLPAAEAAIVRGALSKRAEAFGRDPETGDWAPEEQRMAQGLVEQSADDLAAAEGPTFVTVVHVEESTLTGETEGNGEVDGVTVCADTARRVMCDSKIEFSVDRPDGTTVGVGRAARRQPAWLERRVRNRDRCCRFPGCSRPIRHIHHVKWWGRDSGPTDSDNLVGLCWHHHHLVHEGGWILEGNADTSVTFTSPVGVIYRCRLQPLRPEVRARVSDAIGVPL